MIIIMITIIWIMIIIITIMIMMIRIIIMMIRIIITYHDNNKRGLLITNTNRKIAKPVSKLMKKNQIKFF